MATSIDVILKVRSYKDFIEKYKKTANIKEEVTKKEYEDVVSRRNLTIGRKYSALEMSKDPEDPEKRKRIFMLKDDKGTDFFATVRRYTIFNIKKGKD